MTPIIVDVFTPAQVHHGLQLARENARLRVDLAHAQERIAAYEQRLDLLQRANEAKDSPRFAQRVSA